MLLVFGRVGGDSFRNFHWREPAPIQSDLLYSYSTQRHQKMFTFENFQDSTHTRQHPPYQGGWGGNMSSIYTRLLVFNRGGPDSYRSRQRRGVTSQEETRFYPASDSLIFSIFFQINGVRLNTTHGTRRALPACCGNEV